MEPENLLPLMKIDLRIKTDAYDERLKDKISTAAARIKAEGATLQDTDADRDLVLMLAEWLWLNRATGAGIPRLIRLALNNRVLGEKAQVN